MLGVVNLELVAITGEQLFRFVKRDAVPLSIPSILRGIPLEIHGSS
jgi:hypothetical protein